MPYKHHSFLESPSPNQIFWRYMDVPKFISLLQNRGLYFPSLRQLTNDDPWEGLPSKLNFNSLHSAQNEKSKLLELQKKSFLDSRNAFFVNCWHMNDGESDCQWKIYGAGYSSLAIVSDFKQVCNAFIDKREVLGSPMIYYHPHTQYTSNYVLHQPFLKRKAFDHEKEFRFVHWDHESLSDGILIEIDIETLIERIVISPLSPSWFVDVITSLIKDYGFNLKVCKSDLLEPL